ncbi:MAG: acyltransferase [Lachnospiraceae bacterium]|nr:acyltransferase [Lachnospiraceae bacterium]
MKKRMANIELLRVLSMMMVVMLHFLGKGDLLPELTGRMGSLGYVAWFLESLCIVAVNVYMLISGYFLVESSFKLSRLLSLVFQVIFYSLLVPVVLVCVGILPLGDISFYQLLQYVFPTLMEQYWFVTAYVLMYLLSPFVATAVHHMSKRQLELTLSFLLVIMSLSKSVLPVQLEMDHFGYDALWFICVFLVAAYIRLYGVPFFASAKKSFAMYFLGAAGIYALSMLLHIVCVKTGSLEFFVDAAYEYNHVFNLFAAVALFYGFLHVKFPEGKMARIICKLGGWSFGVYLLHEQLEVRYLWPKWLGAGRVENVWQLLLTALGAVLVVFLVGVLVDALRQLLFNGLGKLLSALHLTDWIDRIDKTMKE